MNFWPLFLVIGVPNLIMFLNSKILLLLLGDRVFFYLLNIGHSFHFSSLFRAVTLFICFLRSDFLYYRSFV